MRMSLSCNVNAANDYDSMMRKYFRLKPQQQQKWIIIINICVEHLFPIHDIKRISIGPLKTQFWVQKFDAIETIDSDKLVSAAWVAV